MSISVVVGSVVSPPTLYVYLNSKEIDPAPLIERLAERNWVAVAERKRGAPSSQGTNGVRLVVSEDYSEAQIANWLSKAIKSFERELEYV